MSRSVTVRANNPRMAIAVGAGKLRLPPGYKLKKPPKYNKKTRKWKLVFK